tara:strand:+ start:255 stop:482 length:228 start_codon:yes stop_codon:yes gene_type:complete
MAFTCKFKSIWNESKPVYRKLNSKKVAVDVWSKKSTIDFLHYLKFEYIQTSYICSCIMVSVFMILEGPTWAFGIE